MTRYWEKGKPNSRKKKGQGWSNDKFYHTMKWRRLRNAYMKDNPICLYCKFNHKYVVASVCDHIRPRRFGGDDTAYENLQPLCVSCHNTKSAYERNDKVDPITQEIYKINKIGEDAKDTIKRQESIRRAYEYEGKTRI